MCHRADRMLRIAFGTADRVPGQLVEHRLAAAVGQPASEVADGLAVELDRPRRLRGGPQVPPNDASRSSSRIAVAAVIGRVSAVLGRRERRDQPSSLLGRLARLGCTRIGSPGIFG